MTRGPERRLVACADQRPGAVVEILVEVGQHHRALRRTRDRRDETGGCTIGAGRAGDDGRTAPRSAFERLDFVVDQERDPLGPVDEAAFGEPRRPVGKGDLEEVEGDAPIGVIGVRRQRLDLLPRRALDDHVVDQRRKIAGERVGLSGRRRDQRRLAGIDDQPPIRVNLANRAAERLSPGAHKGCERVAARQRTDCRRQGGARSLFALGEDCRRLVWLEGAQRRDARQDQSPRAAGRDQRFGQSLGGALRRHVDRRVSQRRRSGRPGEAVDQNSVQESAAQGWQERRAGRNCEDSGLANRHARLLCGAWGKARRA